MLSYEKYLHFYLYDASIKNCCLCRVVTDFAVRVIGGEVFAMVNQFPDLTPLVHHQTPEAHSLDGYDALLPPHTSPFTSFPDSYLLTKVTVPPVQVRMLARSPLFALLEICVPLTLLSAGAGYGKTTLLASWAHTQRGHIAWLTLEGLENDPLRFWTYVLLALRTCIPSFGEKARTWLSTQDTAVLPHLLTLLLNELTERNEALTLILDDYQVIEEPSIHRSLAFFLAHAPACLHLILATRADPALSLPRLRAHGQLVEIREAQLKMTVREAEHFLAHTMSLTLSQTDVLALWQRTEGWVAGLQLAALTLRSHADPSLQTQRISGSHLFLLEYVQEDILAHVELATQTFLLHTSVLTRMTAALCTAVTGEQTSQVRLLALERANLFVTPQDAERHWYRVHPLVREAMLARLRVQEPELLPRLHQRAAHWYAEQQLVPEAIDHALEAGDFGLATDLIECSVKPQSWRNAYHSLRGWLSRLPQTMLQARPQVCLLAAEALFMTTPIDARSMLLVEEYLQTAWQGYRHSSNQAGIGIVLAFRATLRAFRGYFEESFTLAREALSLLPETDVQWRGHALSILGMQAFMQGELQLARTILQQADEYHEISGLLGGRQFVALMFAEINLAQGDRACAAQGFRQVLSLGALHPDQAAAQLTDMSGRRRAHFEYAASYSLAALFYEENRFQEAQQALATALVEGQFALISVLTPGLLLQVRLLCDRDEETAAQALLEACLSHPRPPEAVREIQFCQAFLAFRRGDLPLVSSWAAGLSTRGQPLSRARALEEVLLLARLHIAQDQPAESMLLLTPLLKATKMQGHGYAVLQILMLQALAGWTAGKGIQARELLLEAVARAAPQGYVRLFLQEGQAIEQALRELLLTLHEPELRTYTRALLHASTPARSPHDSPVPQTCPRLLDPLTPQEQRVLGLLAQGASNRQIASALVIGLSTVKKHVSNLLGKLQAENRTQAIVQARKFHLLEEQISEPVPGEQNQQS